MANKKRKQEPPIDVEVFEQRDGAFDARAIREFYEANGYAAMRLLDDAQCAAGVYELYENLLMTQPWNDPHWHGGVSPLVLKDERGEIRFERGQRHDAEHRRRVVAALTKRSFRPAELKMLEHHWPLHVGFGAPCDDIGFHLPLVWQARQSPAVYDVVSHITGLDGVDTGGLLVDINRPIMRLPKRGENEFLHWDLDINVPFKQHNQNIQGKVAYTPSRFECVPGTHTPEFQASFLAKYGAHKGGNKTALNVETHADEFARQQTFKVPAGCYFIWNNQMLHGVTPSASDANIEFGFYMGFFPAADIEHSLNGVREDREDRLRSYERGVAPKLWPSGDTIHFYPKRWINFHKNIQKTIDKMPAGHPSITTRTNAERPPRVFPELLPWRPIGYDETYRPPKLTPLGERLLGTKPWPFSRSPSGHSAPSGHAAHSAPSWASGPSFDGAPRYVAVKIPALAPGERVGVSRLVARYPWTSGSALYTDDDAQD